MTSSFDITRYVPQDVVEAAQAEAILKKDEKLQPLGIVMAIYRLLQEVEDHHSAETDSPVYNVALIMFGLAHLHQNGDKSSLQNLTRLVQGVQTEEFLSEYSQFLTIIQMLSAK